MISWPVDVRETEMNEVDVSQMKIRSSGKSGGAFFPVHTLFP
jgi:hypothetical protein